MYELTALALYPRAATSRTRPSAVALPPTMHTSTSVAMLGLGAALIDDVMPVTASHAATPATDSDGVVSSSAAFSGMPATALGESIQQFAYAWTFSVELAGAPGRTAHGNESRLNLNGSLNGATLPCAAITKACAIVPA
eukprot:7386147-Prymnesium_polylepis.1